MKFVEMTQSYKELKHDYELQCLENSRKQEQILELRRQKRELEEQIQLLKEKLESSDKEYDKLLQSLSKKDFEEVANDNTRKSKPSKSRNRQNKKI